MICNNCGSGIERDSVFCPSCGVVPGSSDTQAIPVVEPTTDPAFEPTQHIPVAESAELPATPPPAQPVAQQPSVPAPPQPARPAAPTRQPVAQPVFVPQRRSVMPYVAGALLLAALLVLAFLLRGIFSDDGDEPQGPATTEAPQVTTVATTQAPAPTTPETTVQPPTFGEAAAYTGPCFSAAVPDGWELSADNEEKGYGMRTTWRRGNDLLFVDSSPITDPNVTSRDAAQGQFDQRTTATSGLLDEGGDAWGYTYTRSGAPAIAIYKVTDRGFGVVGASAANTEQTLADARALIASIEVTNPTCDTGLTN